MDVLFLQGPSGSGKTTLARLVAQKTGWRHLDRDEIEKEVGGDRTLIYQHLAQKLSDSLVKRERVIVDAPFLYEDKESFVLWLKDVPGFSYLPVSLDTAPDERKKRRQKRGLFRDQIKNWSDVLTHEEEVYQPLPRSLILPGSITPRKATEMLLYFLKIDGRDIRAAGDGDLLLVQDLKDRILQETFSQFLYEDELRKERQQVASLIAIEKLLQENEVFLAERNGEAEAMLALSGVNRGSEGKTFRKIFSGYSKGDSAASAIGLYFLSKSREEELDYLLAHVYRDNEMSQHVLSSFGFSPDGESHENPLVPRVPIEHWLLSLK